MTFPYRHTTLCALTAAAFSLAVSAAAAPTSAPPVAPSPSGLAAHKALYVITMTTAHPGGSYVDVNGKMYFEFNDACSVWTTNQKFMLRTFDTDGKEGSSDSDYSSSEDKGGDNFTFSVRKTQDGESELVRGIAKRNGPNASGAAEFSKPDRKVFKLPSQFLFPTAQTLRMIEHAKKGDQFFNGQMFDGTEVSGTVPFNAILLKPATAPDNLPFKSVLLKAPAHRVHIAFYPAAGAGTQATPASDNGGRPDYEQTMTLHDNGVISDMEVDMGDYSVHYSLQAIETVPRPHC